MWLHSLKVAQLLRSAACLHTNQSRSYLNHLVQGHVLLQHCMEILKQAIMRCTLNLRRHRLSENLKGTSKLCRSQWPRGLRRRPSAARLLRLWVRIPPGAWMFVCCECCVLSGRGHCDELITRPEESYRLWRVVVCDQETSTTRRLKPATGL